MNPLLTIAIKAARHAGGILLRHVDRLDGIAVEQKGRNDFVSEVDRMAEDDIVDTIRARYPNHKIVAEERGGEIATEVDDADEVEWIIDPLDGTANYLHRHPQFAISIAARVGGELHHGVVFDPLRNELYTASRGQGAQLNNHRLRVSQLTTFDRAIIATGFPFKHTNASDFDLWMQTFHALMKRVADMRRGGSAALDLAYLAGGRLDGYWESGLSAWDIAAGALLVREAGGFVADFDGQQNFLHNGQIVAANANLFSELLTTVTLRNAAQ